MNIQINKISFIYLLLQNYNYFLFLSPHPQPPPPIFSWATRQGVLGTLSTPTSLGNACAAVIKVNLSPFHSNCYTDNIICDKKIYIQTEQKPEEVLILEKVRG